MSKETMKKYKDKEWLYQKYTEEGFSEGEIGKLFGISKNAIYYWMRKFNIRRRTLKEGYKLYYLKNPNAFKGKHGSQWGKKGRISGSWKGGRTIDGHGYVLIYQPNHPHSHKSGYVFEHRLVMEKKLGRYLTKNEIVHHINGIRNENRENNLELITENKHKLKKKEKHQYRDNTRKTHKKRYADGYRVGFQAGFNRAINKTIEVI